MPQRVLAIDPGFDRLGAAVLDNSSILFSVCIETDRKSSHENRLLQIGEEIRKIIKKWKPETLAIEQLFFNQNTTNALKVAEARGVALIKLPGKKMLDDELDAIALGIAHIASVKTI